MRLGSLFSGYGGLDLAVEGHFGAEQVWHCELDPHASTVMAAHWDTPNLGDITTVDWARVEPVDILCGGFPCQDISSAGLGAGIKEGTRSGLWFRYADAVRFLRPRYVVVENVSALLVRGLDIVLGDLAELGYDAQWCSVRASDVGAPHRRQRVFLVAHSSDIGQQRVGLARDRWAGPSDGSGSGRCEFPGGRCVYDECHSARICLGAPPDPDHRTDDGERARPQPGQGGVAAAYAGGERHGGGQVGGVVGLLAHLLGPVARERQRSRQEPGDRSATAWGPYAGAVRRWEQLTRPAPAPTDDQGRLSPWLVEWLMGLPEGWVCDHLARRPALRALGNGVVPQQASLALDLLAGGSR